MLQAILFLGFRVFKLKKKKKEKKRKQKTRHKTKRGKEIYTRATTNNNPFVAKRFAKRERKRRRGPTKSDLRVFFIFSIEEEGVCAFFDEDEDEEERGW